MLWFTVHRCCPVPPPILLEEPLSLSFAPNLALQGGDRPCRSSGGVQPGLLGLMVPRGICVLSLGHLCPVSQLCRFV